MDTPNRIKDVNDLTSHGWGMRHIQTFLLFLAMFFAYNVRVATSVAVVAMTDVTAENSFNWDIKSQSMILSSFFWGYVVMQIPIGIICSKYGGRWPIIIFLLGNTVLSAMIPWAAYKGGWLLVCIFRAIQGFTQASVCPATHTLVGKWIPQTEKSSLTTIIYAGGTLGSGFQLVLSGLLANRWGWPSIFYVNGGFGAVVTILFFIFGSESPQKSKHISPQERFYIQNSLGHVGGEKKHPTPWKSILTSFPFISVIITHAGQNWGFWTLMTEMPTYLSLILGVDIKSNGLLSALPYFVLWLLVFPMGYLSDLSLKKKWLSITATRKLCNSIGLGAPGIMLLFMPYLPDGNLVAAMALLTCIVGVNGAQYGGYLLSLVDMAPNFAGNLMGISNFFANITSLLAPLVAGYILEDETSKHDWQKVFYLASAIYLITNLIYVIFGTSEVQSWNEPKAEKGKNETDEVTVA